MEANSFMGLDDQNDKTLEVNTAVASLMDSNCDWKSYLDAWGFHEVEPDADGFFSGLVLPPDHATFLWRLGWISLIAGIYGLWRGHYTLAPVPLGVFINSLNYWRDPSPTSIRRYFDILWAISGLIYQLWRSVNSQYAVAYWIVMFITVCFFPLGHAVHSTSAWLGTFCHAMVHVGGNIGNVILYSGTVEKIKPL